MESEQQVFGFFMFFWGLSYEDFAHFYDFSSQWTCREL